MSIYFTCPLTLFPELSTQSVHIYLDVQLSESLMLGAHPDSITLDMAGHICYSFFASDKTKTEIRENCRCDGDTLICIVQLVVSCNKNLSTYKIKPKHAFSG